MEELILKYINRNFDILFKNKFVIVFKSTNKIIDLATFEYHVNEVFGYNLKSELPYNWRIEKIKTFTDNFSEFLSKCNLVLGAREWLVIHETYGQISFDDIKNHSDFANKEDDYIKGIKGHFNFWFNNEVITASEKAWKETF